MVSTTTAAVSGKALRPVVAACSIYRCARILNTFIYLIFSWHLSKSATETPKRATTRDYDESKAELFDFVYEAYRRDGFSIKACHRCMLDMRIARIIKMLSSLGIWWQ